MESSSKIRTKLTLKHRWRRLFSYLIIFGIITIGAAFLCYYYLVGQAFADRGVAENAVPMLYSPSNSQRDQLLRSVNGRFKCSSPQKIDVSHFNSVGMFPFLLENHKDTCNRAADFVGYDRFLDAILHGERQLGVPASSSKLTSYGHHHPGLETLKNLLERGDKFDRSVEFYWWMFPVPIGIPNRGFSYAIFQGDYENLKKAAKARGFIFDEIYLAGLKVFFSFQGWDIEKAEQIKNLKFQYDERDHIVAKAWISLKCFCEYQSERNENRQLYM